MQTTTSKNQQTTNPFSVSKSLIGLGLTASVAFGVSYLYGIVSAVIPLIYLMFVCTVFFGTILGYVTIFSNYFSKQLHQPSKLGIAALSGVFAWYCSWVSYIIFLGRDQVISTSEAYFTNLTLLFQPTEVFRIMGEINGIGLWAIGDIPLRGSTLTIFWVLEAIVIIGVPIILVFKQHEQPFSEKHNSWYREFILEKDFGSVFGLPSFKEDLTQNPIETIDGIGFGKANLYTQVSIYYLPQEGVQYLSLFDIRIDREDKTEKNEIVHLIEISTQDAQHLMDKWKAKKSLVPFL